MHLATSFLYAVNIVVNPVVCVRDSKRQNTITIIIIVRINGNVHTRRVVRRLWNYRLINYYRTCTFANPSAGGTRLQNYTVRRVPQRIRVVLRVRIRKRGINAAVIPSSRINGR